MPHTSHLALEAVVHEGDQTLARCLVQRGRYIIGSERKNEIVVRSDSVAEQHARLTVVNETEFFIEDMGNGSGTFVDGVFAETATPFTLDSEVVMGSTRLEFQRGGLPASVFRHLPDGFLRPHRHQLGEAVVQGSTSTIHEARDLSLGRTVAMKIMLPSSQAKAAHVLRFIREAQIAAQLQHPGILPIYELSLDDEHRLFCTTRFVEGESLADLLDGLAEPEGRKQPGLRTLIEIFQRICDTVAFAHSRGVVHRTLRPEAITVGDRGEVFVNQWGLAKLPSADDSEEPLVQAPAATSEPGVTPYSAPEQTEGSFDPVDVRTDVHALGGILYRILTLRDPLTVESESELLEKVLTPRIAPATRLAGEPPCWHLPGGRVPEPLAAVAMKALELAPDQRHASVAELQKEVAAWQDGITANGEAGKIWKPLAGLLGRH